MVGIRDVAKRAQVSPATVSRLLNEDQTLSVTEETRQRVLAAVKELDYQVKKKIKRNASICIITPVSEEEEIDDPYFRAIRLGLTQEARQMKIAANRIFRLNEDKPLPEIDAFGAVIVMGHLAKELLAKLYQHNPNIIVVDDPLAEEKYDMVYVDIAKATENHLDRLYDKGHRNIAFIGGLRNSMQENHKFKISDDDIRAQTYRDWMVTRGLSENIQTYLAGWGPLDGMRLAEQLIEDHQDKLPTAILVASDPLAVGVYRALAKNDITIPDDIAVVSFDNVEVSEFMTPPLSTADLKTSEMGKAAIRLASEKIQEVRGYPIGLVIPAEIIVRESE
ncbi:LacI family DNA-binding transcriptional regulator [Enterococcus sp. LJL120]